MQSLVSFISYLEKKQIISSSNVEFAHLWLKLDPKISLEQLTVFIAAYYFDDQGHVALDQEMLNDFLLIAGNDKSIQLIECLSNSELVGDPSEFKPFIVFDELVYLQKNYKQEEKLAIWLNNRSDSKIEISDTELLRIEKIASLQNDELQRKAVVKSFTNPIVFLTGGPGTGKTYTVQQIIKAHREFFGESYSIKIAAPTGKAAQRINDSLSSDIFLETKATTIHQLLGAGDILGGFRFNEENPIPSDLIIIDEASMMDLNLWSGLIESISTKTRMVIVGDPFQLASVESGAVLNDIYSLKTNHSVKSSKLIDAIIELEKRHRFSKESGIQLFADAVNRMDVDEALQVLENKGNEDVTWVEPTSKSIHEVINKYAIQPSFGKNKSNLNEYRILSALRNGRLGCNNLNSEIEGDIKSLFRKRLSNQWFDKRVVMINKNDYRLGLQNGEIGIYKEESDTVQFESDKEVPVDLISSYESGYCITIHKSQGSEYDHVAIILPEHKNSILTKELLYTAVTRARKSVLVVGNKKILTHSISNKTKRKSGLTKQLETLLG